MLPSWPAMAKPTNPSRVRAKRVAALTPCWATSGGGVASPPAATLASAAATARSLGGEVVADLEGRGARLRGHGGRLRRVALRLDAERLGQLAGLVHLADDVAAADQLAVDEQLGDRRPVRDRAQLLADARVGQDVDRRVGGAEGVERGDRAGAEAAHGLLGAALHEEDDFVLGDRLGNLVADGVAHQSALVTRDRAWMGPPMSVPNTAYTRRCCSMRLMPENSGAMTVARKWSPPPVRSVTSTCAPGIAASMRCLSSSGEGI